MINIAQLGRLRLDDASSTPTAAEDSSTIPLLGFTPIEAIMSTTRYCTKAMGLGYELGQIKEGYLTDLLLSTVTC